MRNNHRNSRKNLGFTLIEVVIAVGLMAVVSVLSWRALSSMTSASEVLQDQYKHLSQIERVFAVIEGDLNQLASPAFFTGILSITLLPALNQTSNTLSNDLSDDLSNTDLGLVRTQRNSVVLDRTLNTNVLTQQTVRYRLKEGRFERLISDQTSRLLTLPPIEESAMILLEDVQSVSWSFYPPQGSDRRFDDLFSPVSIETFSLKDYQDRVRPLWQNLLSQTNNVSPDSLPKLIDLRITLQRKNSSSPVIYQRTFLVGFGV